MLKEYMGTRISKEFCLYPDISDRLFWNDTANLIGESYIAAAYDILEKPIELLPASKFMLTRKTGNRSIYEKMYFDRRRKMRILALAECFTNKGVFIEKTVDYLMAVLEESAWSLPAHVGTMLPVYHENIPDLFAAETAAEVSAVFYLIAPVLGDIRDILGDRIMKLAEERLFSPLLSKKFPWSGFTGACVNNWNPWVNSNTMFTALTMVDDEKRKQEIVDFLLCSTDFFIEGYFPDGGCDEGPSYWGVAAGALHEMLEMLLIATDGKIDIYHEPLIKNMADYICKAHISNEYVVDFADAPAKIKFRSDIIYNFGKYTENIPMIKFGTHVLRIQTNVGLRTDERAVVIRSIIKRAMALREIGNNTGCYPFYKNTFCRDICVMTARDKSGSDEGLFLAAKGGHNDESHNHNDIGSFIIYSDGKPKLIDPSMETYTAKTFSAQRYDLWTMQSAFHNLPTINNVMQSPGRCFRSSNTRYNSEGGTTNFAINIEGAYPVEAGIKRWNREFIFESCKCITLIEDFELYNPTDDLFLTLMTSEKPETAKNTIQIDGFEIVYDGDLFNLVSEEIALSDKKMVFFWGDKIYRIKLKVNRSVITEKTSFVFKQIAGFRGSK